MQLRVEEDYERLSVAAARWVADAILDKPRAALALPTGNTPLGVYQHLTGMARQGLVDFSQVVCFNLDEYLGLPPHHPQSFRAYMQKHVWGPWGLRPDQVHIPSTSPDNPLVECQRYDEALAQVGGLDLAILGLGTNGHIAFNEPGTPWESTTHVAMLTEETRGEEAANFGDLEQVPRQAITMGIKTLMRAGHILLLVSGERKAPMLARAVRGPINPDVPASILQLHPRLVVLADRAAAGLL